MAVPFGAPHRGGGVGPVDRPRLGVGQVDQVVLLEIGVQGDVHQAAQAPRQQLGQAGDRVGIQHAVADDAQAPVPLGDEHVPVRQEGHAPGMVQALGDHRDVDRLLVGLDVPGPIAQRGRLRRAAPRGAGRGSAGGAARRCRRRRRRRPGLLRMSDAADRSQTQNRRQPDGQLHDVSPACRSPAGSNGRIGRQVALQVKPRTSSGASATQDSNSKDTKSTKDTKSARTERPLHAPCRMS